MGESGDRYREATMWDVKVKYKCGDISMPGPGISAQALIYRIEDPEGCNEKSSGRMMASGACFAVVVCQLKP